jgi:hypothetical protein
LGTDSEPEPPGKMNLNYDNLVQRNPVTGAASVTNFYAWRPIDFFTNAANRLLWANTEAWAGSNRASFLATFGVTQPFGITNIPVLVSNRFVYSSSIQRLLQLAANMYDATTNRMDARGPVPSIFRPYFRAEGSEGTAIGFVTAAAVCALRDAKAAGAEVPAKLLSDAVEVVASTRQRGGAFNYFRGGGGDAGGREAEAAFRSPLYAMVLKRAGEGDADGLRESLDLYLKHREHDRRLGIAEQQLGIAQDPARRRAELLAGGARVVLPDLRDFVRDGSLVGSSREGALEVPQGPA